MPSSGSVTQGAQNVHPSEQIRALVGSGRSAHLQLDLNCSTNASTKKRSAEPQTGARRSITRESNLSTHVAVDQVLVEFLLAAGELEFTAAVANLGQLLERQLALLEVCTFAAIKRSIASLAHLLDG